MRKGLVRASALLLAALMSVVPVTYTGADSDAVLVNNVLHSTSVLTPLHPTDPNRVIGLGIGLQGANPSGEVAFIAAAYDPSSPQYGQFLDPDQYEQTFGVPQSRFNAAVAWLQGGGLSVQAIPGVSEYILASGKVSQIQSLLHVSIADYHIDAGDFYANTTAPTVPASLGIIGIAGLNNLEGPRLSRRTTPGTPGPAAPSASMDTGLTSPSDLWSIYNQPGGNRGEGQSMAIFGWGTTNNTLSDLRQFEVENRLPGIPLTITYFGAESQITDSGGEVEWNLDTQASTGMAPNAVSERLYFGKAGTDADLLGAYNGWAGDKHGPLQGSSSFGGCEEAPGTDALVGNPANPGGIIIAGNPKQDLWEAALRRIVAEGRTMFASTGDTGAGCPAVAIVLNGVTLIPTPMLNYPSVSSFATAVGGTVLYFNDAGSTPASRAFEYSWNYTGGGDSKFIAAGAYQNTNPAILLTRCLTDPHGTPYPAPGPLCRGIPDVAAQSGDIISNGYKITVGGKNDQSGGGTSLSSPLWLGMWTRMQAAARSRKGNGFADPAIYRIASNPSKYVTDFFDVGGMSGDTVPNCNGPVPATNCSRPGWDYNSGWGTPDVTHLTMDLDGTTTPSHMTTPKPVPTLTPTISGTTCPGPQMPDVTADAPNDYPAGDGSNMDNLDIVSAVFASPDASTLKVTMTVRNLAAPPPPANLPSAVWQVTWTYNGTQYVAEASSNGVGRAGLFAFTAGPAGSPTQVTGTATLGANGTLVWTIPLAVVGNPPAGASLSLPFAETHGSFTVQGTGLFYTAAADRAPDLGFGAPWVIGRTC